VTFKLPSYGYGQDLVSIGGARFSVRYMPEDEQIDQATHLRPKGTRLRVKVGTRYRNNMLLFSGVGLLLIAMGMVLSSILP